MRGGCLADGTDVVALALDREQHRAVDGPRVDARAAEGEFALGEPLLLEDPGDGFEIELGRQVEQAKYSS